MSFKKITSIFSIAVLFVFVGWFLGANSVRADVAQMKVYKEAYPGTKPKCIACHLEQLPKKDAGKHELNDYGKKAKAEMEKPTAEVYKKIGKAPDQKPVQK